MVTFQAGRAALVSLLLLTMAACNREQQDWHSAESADTSEGWQRFLEQHPDSDLVNEARNRIAQLDARRDFEHADRIGTMDAYRDFLAHHPSGKWSEHARIRIESFSFGSAPRIDPPTPEEAASFSASGVRALRLASSAVPPPAAAAAARARAGAATTAGNEAPGADGIQPPVVPASAVSGDAAEEGTRRAVPGEAAQAPADPVVSSPAASSEGGEGAYGVQLGAFGSEASADREWRRLQGRFGAELRNLSPRIVLAESDSRQLYRLQAPAAGEAQARAICDSLKEQDQACIPVLPR
ncbi:MAG: SPOR domain-containing protein [Gammaproteobacteria bacterium]|nr:SPOR domain-containing protein [Gammaproteobacteria bacterium]